MQTAKHVSWASVGPDRRLWRDPCACGLACRLGKRAGMFTAVRTIAFVGLCSRVVRSSGDIRYLAEHV